MRSASLSTTGGPLFVFGLWHLAALLCLGHTATAFLAMPPAFTRPSAASTMVIQMSILDDINEKMGKSKDSLSGFNPLNYQASSAGAFTPSSSAQGSSSTRISLRKTTMTELLAELLETVQEKKDDAQISQQLQEILEKYQEFLLEPLDDDDAVLDEDSIFSSAMSRAQRYQTYQKNMEERIRKARNPQVQKVLTFMKDFVMGFE